MNKDLDKKPNQEPIAKKGKRPPRSLRKHRRRLLALKRSGQKVG